MGRRTVCAVVAALALGMPAAGPAGAQVGPDARPYIYGRPGPDREDYGPPPPGRRPPPPPADDYDRRPPPPPPPPPPEDDYDRPRPPGRHRYVRPRWDDSVCATARGTCLTRPAPPNAPCGCEIPGFGYARGQIED
ncbi:hypothetical protein [Methylobacterium sp. J-070]|uniref:hypothetical protein n=1 Tax=Methylobacterium sp. J-070 TaxID=2836650 RepID=UPI001FBC100F|nr:hypothetical protein [Methylobacterium sp. J-070]MCJ2052146.1 hypothetical protein [Methylobacterium sp. J-070]